MSQNHGHVQPVWEKRLKADSWISLHTHHGVYRQRQTISSVGEGAKIRELSRVAAGGSEMVRLLWKMGRQLLPRLIPELPYNRSILLLSMKQRDTKAYVHTKAHANTSPVVLFPTAPKWKQSECLSAEKRIKKMWSTHMVGYYSATARKEALRLARAWMKLGNRILRGQNSSRKTMYCMNVLGYHNKTPQT